MATVEEWESSRANLAANLTKLSGTRVADLMKSDELGKNADFSPYERLFQNIVGSAGTLAGMDLTSWPVELLQSIDTNTKLLVEHFEGIKSFKLSRDTTPLAWRDRMGHDIAQRAAEFFRFVLPLLAYETASRAVNPDLRVEYDRRLSLALEKAESQADEISRVLEKARQAAQETGIASYAELFKGEACRHKDQAQRWYWATVFSVMAILIYGMVIFFVHPLPD